MWSKGARWLSDNQIKVNKMKTYLKPETEIVLLTASQNVMQIIETSTTTGKVDPTNPDDEGDDLANRNSIWETWEEE